MSKITRRALCLGVLVLSLIVGGIWWWATHNPNLEGWVKQVQRPGYVLLYKTETSDHYFALFDAGGSQVAICYRAKGKEPSHMGFSIYGEDGRDLQDWNAPKRSSELDGSYNYVIARYQYTDGVMYPIRKDYRGSIVVKVTAEETTVLNTQLAWNPM